MRASFLCAISLLIASLVAAGASAEPAGEVTHVSGTLVARKADGSSKILAPKSTVDQGDVLATADGAYARVKFTDGGEITLRPNTQLRIDRYVFGRARPQEDSLVISLLMGGLRTITGLIGKRDAGDYAMRTSVATIGIRGTGYGAQLCQGDCQNLRTNAGTVPPDGLHLDVFDGAIYASNAGGSTDYSLGDFGFVPEANVRPLQVPVGQSLRVEEPAFDAQSGIGRAGCVVQ